MNVVVYSFVARVLLPLQVIFTCITQRTFSSHDQRRAIYVTNGWDFTYSDNHWSNFENTKCFVENIMVIYHRVQI
jgi:hypothetical protein